MQKELDYFNLTMNIKVVSKKVVNSDTGCKECILSNGFTLRVEYLRGYGEVIAAAWNKDYHWHCSSREPAPLFLDSCLVVNRDLTPNNPISLHMASRLEGYTHQ